ncbi:MAG: hypothetical protein V4501_11345 [Pseudomonadota bacterium]
MHIIYNGLYREKLQTIEAIQFDRENREPTYQWLRERGIKVICDDPPPGVNPWFGIGYTEFPLLNGHWITYNPDAGMFNSLTEQQFKARYEEVKDE